MESFSMFLDKCKSLMELFLRYIDNGKFFREPMKWLYILCGIIPFLITAYFLYQFIDEAHFIYRYINAWSKITLTFGVLLAFVYALVLDYLGLVFWINRSKQINEQVREGDQIIALPVLAHFVKTLGEGFGTFASLQVVGVYAIMYICMMLNGFDGMAGHGFEGFMKALFYGLLIFLGIVVGACLFAYGTIFLSRTLSEKIRVKAMLANDLRDVADIHRAATMPQ